jgi:flagellar biosynthesis protein FlhG
LKAFPKDKAALAYRQLANKVDSWPVSSSPRGHLEFFVERLVQGARAH